MKLFGVEFGGKKPKGPKITLEDQEWVKANLAWLHQTFGNRFDSCRNLTFKPENFLEWVVKTDPEALLSDFCHLYDIPVGSVSINIFEDLRDTSIIEYQIQGHEIDMSLESTETPTGWEHVIHLSKSVTKQGHHLMRNMAIAIVKIQLNETAAEYDGDDLIYFQYMTAVYMGLGYLIAPNIYVVERQSDGITASTFTSGSTLPVPILAYTLAFEHVLRDEQIPDIASQLSSEIRRELNLCFEYLSETGAVLPEFQLGNNESDDITMLFSDAEKYFDDHNYVDALICANKIITQTDDPVNLSYAYNMLGYVYLLKGQFDDALEHFEKSAALNPDLGYPLTNQAYCLIKMGIVDDAKDLLDQASRRAIIDPGYIDRTWALIHAHNNDFERAESSFRSSFEKVHDWVDLLEYDFAIFLLEMGRKEEAIAVLELAEERQEPQVIALLNELQEA